jgi:hypothetical protein
MRSRKPAAFLLLIIEGNLTIIFLKNNISEVAGFAASVGQINRFFQYLRR